MSEISSDWSLAALLLFGGVFTALAAGAAIFLAESWFQQMRQRREHFKIWQDRQLKIWQEQQRESFLRLDKTAKKARSEVTKAFLLLRPENQTYSTLTRRGGRATNGNGNGKAMQAE